MITAKDGGPPIVLVLLKMGEPPNSVLGIWLKMGEPPDSKIDFITTKDGEASIGLSGFVADDGGPSTVLWVCH
jgi:hypothetical protein